MIYRKKSFVKVYELRKIDELQTDEFRNMDELLKIEIKKQRKVNK